MVMSLLGKKLITMITTTLVAVIHRIQNREARCWAMVLTNILEQWGLLAVVDMLGNTLVGPEVQL